MFPPVWSSCARAWSRLAWYVRGSISSSRSPARTNWLSRIGSVTIGPDTRGTIWITLACTWPSRVQGFSRYTRHLWTPTAIAARTIAPVTTYLMIGFMVWEAPD